MSALRHELSAALGARPPREAHLRDTSTLRRAAVLCPVIERPSGAAVILTRRSAHLKAHAGQISFPGGKIDSDDKTPLCAALREADEEIGLVPQMVEILGQLDQYDTRTGFLVTPFVGIVDPRFVASPDPGEVEEVFEVPLSFLMDPANHRQARLMARGRTGLFTEMVFGQYRIWGATAAMLRDLAERIESNSKIAAPRELALTEAQDRGLTLGD